MQKSSYPVTDKVRVDSKSCWKYCLFDGLGDVRNVVSWLADFDSIVQCLLGNFDLMS